jgi:hypothetical protein
MGTAFGQHEALWLIVAGLAALVAVELALIASGLLRLPGTDVAEQDPYLWSLYMADADPYVWSAYVAPEYAPLGPRSEPDADQSRGPDRMAS